MGRPNHAETAAYFYRVKPDAYVYHPELKWYQLLPSGAWKQYEHEPDGLRSDVWQTLKAEAEVRLAALDAVADKERAAACRAFLYKVGNKAMVDGVIAFLPPLYNDDDLPKKMDESRHLLAFADAVYDLGARAARSIRPTDYVCLTAGYPLPRGVDAAVAAALRALLHSIWEDDDMLDYVLRTIAACLHGTRTFEEFYVWTGEGGNGKGVFATLVARALGGYFHALPSAVLTKPNDKKDAPNPSLAAARGKRFVQAQEPEASDALQAGTIKELTGGDPIEVRKLYANPVTFTPQFGLFLQTNDIPKLNKLDGGIKRRGRIVPFPFQFVEVPRQAHHRRMDATLKAKVERDDAWRDAMMLLLLETHASIGDTLAPPPAVLGATEAYMSDNNPLKAWLDERYDVHAQQLDDRKYWRSSTELRAAFQEDTRTAASDMDTPKFASLMRVLGFKQHRMGNVFERAVWQEYSESYVAALASSGMYWLGLERRRPTTGVVPEGAPDDGA